MISSTITVCSKVYYWRVGLLKIESVLKTVDS